MFFVCISFLASCISNNADYSGPNLQYFRNVQSWWQCSQHCTENKQCKVWIWLSERWNDKPYINDCYLKAETTGLITAGKIGAVAGTKHCEMATGKFMVRR